MMSLQNVLQDNNNLGQGNVLPSTRNRVATISPTENETCNIKD